ncbi:hypothetical protein Tco_0438701 [Tanacetum coccineum]
MDETLYQSWEMYNDLLFRCPQHDLNNQQKVQIFYRGLDIPSRQMLESQGLIPMMTPARAFKSIHNMAYHSQNWYDRATTWQRISHNSDDIAVITNRLDSLGCDMQKLKESIHAIHGGCKICKGVHLTQECHLKEEGKKLEKLTQAILTNEDDTVNKVKAKMEKVKEVKKESVPRGLPIVNPYMEPIVPPILISGRLKEQEDEAQDFRTLKGLKKVKISRPLIIVVKKMPEYLKYC